MSGPCGCRKPGRQLFDQAIAELDLAPATSMFAGDRTRDVLPARVFGGTAYLIPAPSTPPEEVEESVRAGAIVADSLLDAVQRFLALFPRSSRAR